MLQTKFGKGGISRYFPPCWDENILIRSFSKDRLATIQKLRAGVKMQTHKTKKNNGFDPTTKKWNEIQTGQWTVNAQNIEILNKEIYIFF